MDVELGVVAVLILSVCLPAVAIGSTPESLPLHPPLGEVDDSDVSGLFLPPEPWTAQPTHSEVPQPDCDRSLGAPPDQDGDGVAYWWDQDDDCDFVADENENIYDEGFQVIPGDPWDPDTDGDGVIDGLDLNAAGTVEFTLAIQAFHQFDGWMDPYPGYRWGDPYLSLGVIQLRPYGPAVAELTTVPGFREADNDHPHDGSYYDDFDPAVNRANANTSLPDDVRAYAEDNLLDRPQVQLTLEVRDHDDGSGDDQYDLSNLAGKQSVTTLLVNLWKVSDGRLVLFELSGADTWNGDGDNDDSAWIKLSLATTVDQCGADIITHVRHGDVTWAVEGVTYEYGSNKYVDPDIVDCRYYEKEEKQVLH